MSSACKLVSSPSINFLIKVCLSEVTDQRECISIHLGQAGVQVGVACWQLYCWEHGLGFDGKPFQEPFEGAHTHGEKARAPPPDSCSMEPFFAEVEAGRLVPRTVMVDTEPTVMDKVRTGEYKDLYKPDQLITGVEDAANFARGQYTAGRQVISPLMNRIRTLAENCSGLQGFIVFHALGGGTGSGLTKLFLDNLNEEFSQKCKIEVGIYPSCKLSAVVDPYNAVLCTHGCLPHTDCAIMLDNEAVYGICQKRLDIKRPTYSNLNRLISVVVSSITASLRFEGTLNADLSDFQTNLVPFPRIQFLVMAHSPIAPLQRYHYESMTVPEITSQLFEPESQMVVCKPHTGKNIGCCLLYRGDVMPRDVNAAIAVVKRRSNVRFVDWCPTGFKIAINSFAPPTLPGSDLASVQRAATLLANTSAVRSVWETLDRKFDLMFSKKAFVHWYTTEGMELEEFKDARYDLATLEMDYREVEMDSIL